MTCRLSLEIRLRSATCLSAGPAGREGGVDAEIDQDAATGLPRLRGRTIKGLLHEEATLLCSHLPAAWHHVRARLFGQAGQGDSEEITALLRFGDGTLDTALQEAVAADAAQSRQRRRFQAAAVRDAFTVVRRQTRVDGESGAPAERSLRATRLLRAGLALRLPITSPRPLDPAEQALLAAACCALRRLGLRRNRGFGQVELRLYDGDEEVTTTWLEQLALHWHDPPPPAAGASDSLALPTLALEPEDPVALSYQITLQAPVVLTILGSDANTVGTLRYLSGAALLGAAAQRYLSARPLSDAANDPDFRRLFLTGEVRWLNAYLSAGGERHLPAPLSLQRDKHDQKMVYDAVVEEPGEGAKPDTDRYIRLLDGTNELRWACPKEDLRMHHQRDPEAGRPTEKNGAIFSVVALRAGQRFAGHVLCPDGKTAAAVQSLLTGGELLLGRSRSASYGGAITIEGVSAQPAARFSETGTQPPLQPGTLVLTLLSDYLGVDDHGQLTPEALVPELRRALGLPAETEPHRCFLRTRPVAGYVSVWRMPRTTALALRAGSVVVFRNAQVEPAHLQALLWDGIGERRAEGFGRVALNWHGQHGRWSALAEAEPAAPRPSTPPLGLLRLLEQALQRHLRAAGEAAARTIADPPSASVLARLRTVIRAADSPEQVRRQLTSFEGKEAGRQLERSRRRNLSLAQFLRELLQPHAFADPRDRYDVQAVPGQLGLPEEWLERVEAWPLQRDYLDALLAALRRQAQAVRDGRSP